MAGPAFLICSRIRLGLKISLSPPAKGPQAEQTGAQEESGAREGGQNNVVQETGIKGTSGIITPICPDAEVGNISQDLRQRFSSFFNADIVIPIKTVRRGTRPPGII